MLALNEDIGAIAWSGQLTLKDAYIDGCYGDTPAANCPEKLGKDDDIGASPILHTLQDGKQVLLVGQKSGKVFALDPDDRGKVVWSRRLSPGGPLGGIEFGLASSGDTLYAPISDIFVSWLWAQPGIAAVRISDGMLLWRTDPPTTPCCWANVYCYAGLSQAVSAVPGAVFGGSMEGHFRAFDAASGKVIWDYDTASTPVMPRRSTRRTSAFWSEQPT